VTCPGRLVAIDDTALWVVERGPDDGVPLIVLHGGPGLDHHEFADYLDPLTERGIRLVFVDQRACGRSERPSQQTWTLERYAQDVIMLARAMRLGRYACSLSEDSLAMKAYGKGEISERHRHRYEVNNEFVETLTKRGFKITGVCPDGDYVEIVELADHPWFLACQFHPEFKSKPLSPHPLFRDFIEAAYTRRCAGNAERA